MQTVNELIEALQALVSADAAAGNLPLRVAYQQSWPLLVQLDTATIGVVDGTSGKKNSLALVLVGGTAKWDENPYGSKDWWDRSGDLAGEYEAEKADLDAEDIDMDEVVADVLAHIGDEDAAVLNTNIVDDGAGVEVTVQSAGAEARKFLVTIEGGAIDELSA